MPPNTRREELLSSGSAREARALLAVAPSLQGLLAFGHPCKYLSVLQTAGPFDTGARLLRTRRRQTLPDVVRRCQTLPSTMNIVAFKERILL